MTLQSMLNRPQIHERLHVIFPPGTPSRDKCVMFGTASVVFTMLYIGAIAGRDLFLQPKHIYAMTDEQSQLTSEADRLAYIANVKRPKYRAPGERWYADNSREQLRDDAIREGLAQVGAIDLQLGIATTANKPRYALTMSFAALFDATLQGGKLSAAIKTWQDANLSPGALARIALALQGAVTSKDKVLVTFPNGETRSMSSGVSSIITKAVIEQFAVKYLAQPAVIWVSESGNKVVEKDDKLAKAIGLKIKPDQNLPDIILADLGPAHPLLIFVEVVHSDGPVSDRRKLALEEIANDAGFPVKHVAFVTAYNDRSGQPFKKTVNNLAWGTYAWFMSEPDGLIELAHHRGRLR